MSARSLVSRQASSPAMPPAPDGAAQPEPSPDIALSRADAEIYARWFQAAADPTRLVILSYLARQQEPVPVGAIIADLGIGQSTASHHLRILREVGFLARTRSRANRLYAINRSCVTRFPEAAGVIMGLPHRSARRRAAR